MLSVSNLQCTRFLLNKELTEPFNTHTTCCFAVSDSKYTMYKIPAYYFFCIAYKNVRCYFFQMIYFQLPQIRHWLLSYSLLAHSLELREVKVDVRVKGLQGVISGTRHLLPPVLEICSAWLKKGLKFPFFRVPA